MAASKRQYYRVHETPRISANQLASYMVASFTAKQRIIRDAHWQPRVVVVRYKDARTAIVGALLSPTRSMNRVTATRDVLQQRAEDSSLKPFRREDARLSMEALDDFEHGMNAFGIAGMNFDAPSGLAEEIVISGVRVNVSLDLVVRAFDRSQTALVGGVLLQFARGDAGEGDEAKRRRTDSCLYAATLIHMFAQQNMLALGSPSRRHCICIDLPRREMHVAPTTYVQRMNNLRAACTEIAALWDRVEPPADYSARTA